MKKVLTTITAIILGILSTIILGAIGVLILVTTAGIVALLIAIFFLLGGILLGYTIFKSVRKRGASGFITSQYASPDLDEPHSGNKTKTK